MFLSGTPDRMADRDRFYPADPEDRVGLPAVKFISNTSYYDRLEQVNGYSGTLYNLSYFQHFLAAVQRQLSTAIPSDPSGNAVLRANLRRSSIRC